MAEFNELIESARDAITVRRVFGDPYQQDGVTVLPAARVMGGAGGGQGQDDEGQNGDGGGFGVIARPAGAFVIRDGEVRWLPAIDANRVVAAVAGALAVCVVAWAISASRGRGQ